jgi:cell division protein FtsA
VRTLSKQLLTEIIEPRVEEIFSLVQQEIHKTGYADLLASGVVITGGATQLQGMAELAEDVLGLPVRRGVPTGFGGLSDEIQSPIYATGAGLIVYGRAHQGARYFKLRESNVYSKVKSRMRSWLGDIF